VIVLLVNNDWCAATQVLEKSTREVRSLVKKEFERQTPMQEAKESFRTLRHSHLPLSQFLLPAPPLITAFLQPGDLDLESMST
jgi:hypothetical protein